MTKKVIISDTNIIIFLGAGDVFEKFCLEFDVYITEDVAEEINTGRAARTEAKDIFYRQYTQNRIQILSLSEEQQAFRDELMRRKTKIDRGESSCIAIALDIEESIFATNDTRAIDVASDILGEDHVINCEEILAVLLSRQLIDCDMALAVRTLMNS